jgi:hypothetical protein
MDTGLQRTKHVSSVTEAIIYREVNKFTVCLPCERRIIMKSLSRLMGVLFVRGNKTYASRHKLKTTMQHLTRYVIHF